MRSGCGRGCSTHRDLEIDKLVGDGAHLVVEAERVVTDLIAGEDKVALALLLALCDYLARRGGDLKVDIERASGLYLKRGSAPEREQAECRRAGRTAK